MISSVSGHDRTIRAVQPRSSSHSRPDQLAAVQPTGLSQHPGDNGRSHRDGPAGAFVAQLLGQQITAKDKPPAGAVKGYKNVQRQQVFAPGAQTNPRYLRFVDLTV